MSDAAVEEFDHLGEAETGIPAVDAALARLDELGAVAVEEHPAVFESVHASLRGVLGSDGS